jgi:hypothetical protein
VVLEVEEPKTHWLIVSQPGLLLMGKTRATVSVAAPGRALRMVEFTFMIFGELATALAT